MLPAAERRAWKRYQGAECAWLRMLRLFPGREAALLNLSRGGALVETRERCAPGAWLQMKIVTERELLWIRAQVVRCEVVGLISGQGVTFRAALGFEHALSLQALASDEYLVPDISHAPAGPAGNDYPESL